MLMRYTCDQLMTVEWYMTINSDINLQELSNRTSIADSSGNFQCHYNNTVTIISDRSRYNAIKIFQGSILKPMFTLNEAPPPISVVQKKVTFKE